MTPGRNHAVALALLSDAPSARDGLLLTVRSAANELMRNVLKRSALQNPDVDRLPGYLEAALDSIADEKPAG